MASATPKPSPIPGSANSQSPQRTAIVTGSARAIGKAIALRLARSGFDVTINDIAANKSLAEQTAAEITQLGRRSTVCIADVSHRAEVDKLVAHHVKELGPLSVMVANAGIAAVKPLLDTTEDEFKQVFDVNVVGVFNCYSAAAKQFIAQNTKGKLIGAASIVAFKPFPLLSPYSASKWAVRGLTQAFAMEMAQHGITANAYAPGIVDTPMWELIDRELGKIEAQKSGTAGGAKGDVMKRYSQELIALGRTSVPEDIAGLVNYMSLDDSDYTTGQTLVCDGGVIMT